MSDGIGACRKTSLNRWRNAASERYPPRSEIAHSNGD